MKRQSRSKRQERRRKAAQKRAKEYAQFMARQEKLKKERTKPLLTKPTKQGYVQTGTADRQVVAGLTNHLIETYQDYVSELGLSYIDGFMAAHNFHMAVVLHLEEQSDHHGLWLNQASATFEQRIKRELLKQQSQKEPLPTKNQ